MYLNAGVWRGQTAAHVANAAAASGAAVAATLDTGVVANNNALTWTAKDAGAAGNGISVRLKDPAGNNQALSVAVVGNDITVNVATGAGGAITSTAADIITAIEADAGASALVGVANKGASTGAAAVTAAVATALSGGVSINTPTKAEFDALVAKFNAINAALQAAGLMADS